MFLRLAYTRFHPPSPPGGGAHTRATGPIPLSPLTFVLPYLSCSALTGRRPIPFTPTHFRTRGRFALPRLRGDASLTPSYINRSDATRRGRRGYIAHRAYAVGTASGRTGARPSRSGRMVGEAMRKPTPNHSPCPRASTCSVLTGRRRGRAARVLRVPGRSVGGVRSRGSATLPEWTGWWMKPCGGQPQNHSPCPRASARSVLTGRRLGK